jgi:hypothetical protein
MCLRQLRQTTSKFAESFLDLGGIRTLEKQLRSLLEVRGCLLDRGALAHAASSPRTTFGRLMRDEYPQGAVRSAS